MGFFLRFTMKILTNKWVILAVVAVALGTYASYWLVARHSIGQQVARAKTETTG